MWNIFNLNSNSLNMSSNLGLSGQIDGFNTESVAGLGLTSVILGYNVRNYKINKENLNINSKNLDINTKSLHINQQNLEVSNKILTINEHIRDIADEHLDIDILLDISQSVKDLNEATNKILSEFVSTINTLNDNQSKIIDFLNKLQFVK